MLKSKLVTIFLAILSFFGLNKAASLSQSKTVQEISVVTPTQTVTPTVTKKGKLTLFSTSNKASPTPILTGQTVNNNQNASSNSSNVSVEPTNVLSPTSMPTSTSHFPTATPQLSSPTSIPTSTPRPASPTPTTFIPTNTPAPVSSTVYVTVYWHPDHEDQVVANAPVKLINKVTGEQLGFGFTSQNGESPRWQVVPNTEFKVTVYKPRDWVTNYCGSEWSGNTGPYGTWQVQNMRIYPPSDPCILE